MKYLVPPPNADEWPTCVALAIALEFVGAPAFMVVTARYGGYHDFLSQQAAPELVLLEHARKYGLQTIVDGVMDGKWDATKSESDRWASSPDGKQTLGMLLRRPKDRREYRRDRANIVSRQPMHERRN